MLKSNREVQWKGLETKTLDRECLGVDRLKFWLKERLKRPNLILQVDRADHGVGVRVA